jgi:hypothetical protein
MDLAALLFEFSIRAFPGLILLILLRDLWRDEP